MDVQEIKDNLNYEMYKQHTDHHQTAGGLPSKSWLPSTSTPRTSAGRIHHESQKRSSGTILAM
jgi:hypothetical protein